MESRVSFFTFSSEHRGRRRRGKYSTESTCILACVGVFALLTASWLLLARPISERFRPLSAKASPPPSADWYLAYFNGDVEHFAIYNDLDGAAEALKHADVLFLGDSRMQYAFRDRAVLHQFFSSRHLSYFILAFGYGEGRDFPEAIIRKFDLHPKWVILNDDPFFGNPTSPVAF